MFYDEQNRYKDRTQNGLKDLKSADEQFDSALKYSPKNWVLWCNKVSIAMRLGYFYKLSGEPTTAESYFDEGLKSLQRVVTTLRPNYDFAWYEIGRIYRLSDHFNEAEDSFEKALKAGAENPNVSAKTINREVAAAAARNADFPLLD